MATKTANRYLGISQDSKRAWRNPWVLGWLALVLVVLMMNGVMITLAVVSNPGLVTEDYYEKGRDLEANVSSRMQARNALGWTLNLDHPEDIYLQRPELVRLSIVDRVGQPLENARVTVQAYRPADADADFHARMEEIGPGLYQARMTFALKGLWDLKVNVERGEDRYDISQRLFVKAN